MVLRLSRSRFSREQRPCKIGSSAPCTIRGSHTTRRKEDPQHRGSCRVYAKAANLGRESQNYAGEIALLAACKAGEILEQLSRGKTGPKKLPASVAVNSNGKSEYAQTLADTKTPERTARHWQALAAVPEKKRTEYIAAVKESPTGEVTASGLLKVARVTKKAAGTDVPRESVPSAPREAEGDQYDYVHNFLTRDAADRLFAFCRTLPAKRLVNPRNPAVNIRKLQMPCYSVAVNFSATPNGYPGEDIGGWTKPGMKLSPNERTNEWMTPLEEAPAEILALREKLSKHFGVDVNYLSLVGYENEKDHITWHKHREDDGRDATVYLISLGATRTFGLRPKDAPRDQWTLIRPVHGSLIVIPSEYNDTHEHAILDDKEPKGLRISINTKCIPPEDIEEHARRKETNWAAQARAATAKKDIPNIYDCHAGKKYPADAVYVGRLTRDRGGRILRLDTPFGNHNKRDLSTEEGRAAWKRDVDERMKSPEFIVQLEALRGKDLLCWCKQSEPNCHARTWLELANK